MAITLVCDFCKNTFQRKKSYGQGRVFCSMKCYGKSNETVSIYKCETCGVDVERAKAQVKNHVFCSKNCAAIFRNKNIKGVIHPNFKHGMGSYRKRALEFYGAACTICGYSTLEVLEVHHRDGNRQNNSIENLDVLCPTHHVEYEVGILSYTRV